MSIEACGYGRNEIDIFDNLVQRYIDGEDVDTDTVVKQPIENDEVMVETSFKILVTIWSRSLKKC